MLLELGFAGASFTKAGDDGNVWLEITATPDGVDDLTACIPIPNDLCYALQHKIQGKLYDKLHS